LRTYLAHAIHAPSRRGAHGDPRSPSDPSLAPGEQRHTDTHSAKLGTKECAHIHSDQASQEPPLCKSTMHHRPAMFPFPYPPSFSTSIFARLHTTRAAGSFESS
jgi:hypothetical protein